MAVNEVIFELEVFEQASFHKSLFCIHDVVSLEHMGFS